MLPLFAILLAVVLICGALAVDISALENRGQTLQNTTDAAALAGVATWAETGVQADAVATIDRIIAQNGVVVGDDLSLNVTFPTPDQVTVELVDNNPQVFLAGAVGIGNDLTRDSTAELRLCSAPCGRIIETNPPLEALLVVGSGDGLIPIAIDNKLYAVNHHGSRIACVDRELKGQCWSFKPLFDSGGWSTAGSNYTEVVDRKIYYTGWNAITRTTLLTCFDAVLEQRCSAEAVLGDHGHSTVVLVDDKLYVFTSDRKVFCYLPGSLNTCSGYAGGKDTALASIWSWNYYDLGAYASSRVVDGSRIYHVLSSNGQVYLHCWNTGDDDPCDSFGTHLVNHTNTGTWDSFNNGRVFFHRNNVGEPTSVCAIGELGLECRDRFNGHRRSGDEANLSGLHAAMLTRAWNGWVGLTTYHPPTNRMFAVNAQDSYTYCHDFVTGSYCNEVVNHTSLGVTRTYGYIPEANCLIGLGHESIFFSLRPDLSGECTAGGGSVELVKCTCVGTQIWPELQAIGTENVESFRVRVLDPDGALLIPNSGSGWQNLLDEPLDLSVLDLAIESLTIELDVEPKSGFDPWSSPTPPAVVVVGGDRDPSLIE